MKSVLLAVALGGTLLSASAQAEVKWVNASPRVAKTAPAVRGVATDSVLRERWVGTRAIVRDVATGKLRKPTARETNELVSSLKKLTARPAAVRTPATTAAGGVWEAAPEQVVIARATPDGAMETLCIQTFEEAADFLGLVKQSSGTSQQ
jgi:hypothetical protein